MKGHKPTGRTALLFVCVLVLIPAGIALALNQSSALSGLFQAANPAWIVVIGLMIFGAVFALNSTVHSYLILAYSDNDKVSMNVGFYYMANAGGRLVGTVLSGLTYQVYGLNGCLWVSTLFLVVTALLSLSLPSTTIENGEMSKK